MKSIFQAIASFFGWLENMVDPENRRLRKIGQIDKEIQNLKDRRDEIIRIMLKGTSGKKEYQYSVELGNITNRISFLRDKRNGLVK